MSIIMVHIYTTENTVYQFSIGYIINPCLHINKMFKTQVEKCLGCSFYIETMQTIKKILMKKNTSVMALVMIDENVGMSINKLFRVLSCVVYTPMDNYVCIDYLLCQTKTLCEISKNITFKETNLNLLLGIGIPELLLNLVSSYGFMLKSNSSVILNC